MFLVGLAPFAFAPLPRKLFRVRAAGADRGSEIAFDAVIAGRNDLSVQDAHDQPPMMRAGHGGRVPDSGSGLNRKLREAALGRPRFLP